MTLTSQASPFRPARWNVTLLKIACRSQNLDGAQGHGGVEE